MVAPAARPFQPQKAENAPSLARPRSHAFRSHAFRNPLRAAAAALRCSFRKATFSLRAPPFFGMGSAPRVGRHLMSSSSTESPENNASEIVWTWSAADRGRVSPRAGVSAGGFRICRRHCSL